MVKVGRATRRAALTALQVVTVSVLVNADEKVEVLSDSVSVVDCVALAVVG
jgi:hypothetical protein